MNLRTDWKGLEALGHGLRIEYRSASAAAGAGQPGLVLRNPRRAVTGYL